MSSSRKFAGSLFQTRGTATTKLLSPNVLCVQQWDRYRIPQNVFLFDEMFLQAAAVCVCVCVYLQNLYPFFNNKNNNNNKVSRRQQSLDRVKDNMTNWVSGF